MSLKATLKRLLIRNARIDHLLCLALKPDRLRLPPVALKTLHPDADVAAVMLDKMADGPWSTPLVDVIYLLKLVKLRQPKSYLEIGCYRGHTTELVAKHADPACKIVAVDIDPAAGSEFRQGRLAERVDLRIGPATGALFQPGERASFDLVFVDADHSYEGVKRDSELSFTLVSPQGLVVWHDYANWGYYSGHCHVPEYLAELSRELPVKHLANTNLALYSPAWRAT